MDDIWIEDKTVFLSMARADGCCCTWIASMEGMSHMDRVDRACCKEQSPLQSSVKGFALYTCFDLDVTVAWIGSLKTAKKVRWWRPHSKEIRWFRFDAGDIFQSAVPDATPKANSAKLRLSTTKNFETIVGLEQFAVGPLKTR